MWLSRLILCLIPLALALDAPPAVRLTPVDPAGTCAAPALALNTNTAAVSRCVDGEWTVATPGTGVPMVLALAPACVPAAIPPLVLLSGPRPALYACTTRNSWTPAGPSCYRADAYPSLAKAVAAAGDNSVILLADGYTAALDSPLLLRGQGISLRCAPGARVVKQFTGDAIRITGRNIAIDGCRLEGQSAIYSGGLAVVEGARGVLLRNSTFSDAGGLALAIYTSGNVTVSGSTFQHNLGSPIFAQDRLDRLDILSNTIDSAVANLQPGIDTIGIHTWQPGGTAANIRIAANRIIHGGQNFAIEVGAFGAQALAPTNVTVADNSITLARDSNGAVSYSTLDRGTVTGNHIDAGGHAISIDAVELVSTTAVVVASNTLAHIAPSATYTISLNGGSRNIIRDNTFAGGIYVGTSRPEARRVEENVIEGNRLSAAAPLPRGLIWFQCNTFHGSVSRNVVRHNILRGNGSGAGVGFENDYWERGAIVDSNQVTGNQITEITSPVAIGPHVTGTKEDW
jgi:hypothetical protein